MDKRKEWSLSYILESEAQSNIKHVECISLIACSIVDCMFTLFELLYVVFVEGSVPFVLLDRSIQNVTFCFSFQPCL